MYRHDAAQVAVEFRVSGRRQLDVRRWDANAVHPRWPRAGHRIAAETCLIAIFGGAAVGFAQGGASGIRGSALGIAGLAADRRLYPLVGRTGSWPLFRIPNAYPGYRRLA